MTALHTAPVLRPTGAARRFAVAVVALALLGPCSSAALAQNAYASPEAAADAFVEAVRRGDRGTLRAVLGTHWQRFMPPGGIDRNDLDAFLAAWQRRHSIDRSDGSVAWLSVGEPGWTLPVPIVKSSSGWRFDLRRGAEALRVRRIGRNELAAIQAVLAYVDAQREYALQDRDGDGVHEYAQKFLSAPGQRDGLFWPEAPGQGMSPLGPLFARGQPQGGDGYHGYFYRILSAQGKNAPGGAYSYMIGSGMRSGFALLAWPVSYGNTGVMSFMVSHHGTVFEKDLGPGTGTAVLGIERFDPDGSWHKVEGPGFSASQDAAAD